MNRILTASVCAVLCSVSAASAQSYNGVVPGSTAVPDHLAGEVGGPPIVTWPGFQATTDGSRVFVQTTIEVKPELKREGGTWVVLLPGVALPAGNARLPLDTHFFNTPVKEVHLRGRDAGGVVLHIEMKAGMGVTPHLRTEKAPNGYFFTYIEFQAGNFR